MTEPAAPSRIHLPCLLAGLGIMLGGTLYPPLFADAHGHADHRLALAVFWAMAAGFVRGVGFIPQHPVPRVLFSGWALLAALGLAALLRFAA